MSGPWQAARLGGWLLVVLFAAVCLLFLGKLASPVWATASAEGSAADGKGAVRIDPPATPSQPADSAAKTSAKVATRSGPATVNTFVSCSAVEKPSLSGAAGDSANKPADSAADTNQAIANTMAAVSAAIAAVTLVLTLGATWIATKSEEIREHERTVTASKGKVEQLHADILHSREVQLDLFASLQDAKEALRRHTLSSGKGNNAWADYVRQATQLELLMSTRAEARKMAFGNLLTYVQGTGDAEVLLRLDIYTRGCHEWLRLNNALPAEGSPSWCLLLSPQEQQAWADSLVESDRAKGADYA